jgi:hypothetical protein
MEAVTQDVRARLPRDGEPNLQLPVITHLTNAVMGTLMDEHSAIHAPTAIGGCAATAGALLLRSVIDDKLLHSLPADLWVMSETVDAEIPLLLRLVGTYANTLGVKWLLDEEPDDVGEPHAQIVSRLEPVLIEVLRRNAVPHAEWPDYVAVTTVDLAFRSGAQTKFAHNVRLGLNVCAHTVPLAFPSR